MESIESVIEDACFQGNIPGAVLSARNTTGSLDYLKAFGVKSIEHGTNMDTDTVMTLASCTKLITTVAVLQIVERGLVGLDDDVAATLPELAKLDILTGMTDGTPQLKKRKNTITLRHLLTHSSGLAYFFMSPLLQEYLKVTNAPPHTAPASVIESFSSPLTFEPGTSWIYGPGLDWAGLLLTRLTKIDLETYFQKYIFDPLKIDAITFWPHNRPELLARRADLALRDPKLPDTSGGVIAFPGPKNIMDGALEECGGQGLFASVPSYMKILTSLLLDDEKLLRKVTTALMFEPQLPESSREAIQKLYESEPTTGPCAVGDFPPRGKYSWGLGGCLTMEDLKGEDGNVWRQKGSLNWSGMLNCFWFLDRYAGVCGFFGAQVLPSGDQKVNEIINLFEKKVYEQIAKL